MAKPLRTDLVLALAFWTIAHAPDLSAYPITLYPAKEVYDPDIRILHERLGLDGQEPSVEDFEDAEWEGWLRTDLRGGDDEGSEIAPWAGHRTSADADSARFEFTLPDIRRFGIGLGDNEGGGERLSVNGQPPIELRKLPGHVGDGRSRAYYVIVEATPDEPPISRIDFDRCRTVRFDHLVVTRSSEPQASREYPPRLVVDLVDGSRLIGEVATDSVVVVVIPGDRPWRLADVHSMRLGEAPGTSTLLPRVGEKVVGEVRFSEIRLRTILGEITIPRASIRRLKTVPRGPHRPGADRRVGKTEPKFLSDVPVFAGKSLGEWLKTEDGSGPAFGNIDDLAFRIPDPSEARSPGQRRADDAIRRIGTRGIPFLVELLARGGGDARDAVKGFRALGALAQPAIPELLALLNEPEESTHLGTLGSLGAIGPAAAEAVPFLLDVLRYESPTTAGPTAAEALGDIGPASAPAVPILVEKIASGTCPWDVPWIVALGKIGSREAVPLLMEVAEGRHASEAMRANSVAVKLRRHKAVEALERLGPSSAMAVPTLVRLLQDPEAGGRSGQYFTERLIRALAAIGPEAKPAVPALRKIADRQGPDGSAASAIARILPEGRRE